MNGVGTEDSLLRKSKNKGRQEKEEGWKRRKTGKGGRQKKEEDRKRRKAGIEGRQEKECWEKEWRKVMKGVWWEQSSGNGFSWSWNPIM